MFTAGYFLPYDFSPLTVFSFAAESSPSRASAGPISSGSSHVSVVYCQEIWTTLVHKKPNLPTKTCPVCQRPFAWRKKWARDWDNVRYCSERCRRSRSHGQ